MDNIASVPNVPSEPKESAPVVTTPPVYKEITTAPLSLYGKDNGMPYAAEYFGFSKTGYQELKDLDIQGLLPKLEIIDNWIQDKVLREEYLDSTESFQTIISNIKEHLGIQDTEPQSRQIEKIALYLNSGQPIASEFFVTRSSKADETDQQRNKVYSRVVNPQSFRKLDGMFSKFFDK